MKKIFIVSLLTMLTLGSMIACSKKETNTDSNSSTASDKTDTTVLQDKNILAIGDSVMLGAAEALDKKIPNIDIDAKESRPPEDAISIIKDKVSKKNYDIIIISLGTNGSLASDSIQQIISTAGNKKVYWLNLEDAVNWAEDMNKKLEDVASNNKNMSVIDWNTEAKKNPGWFWDDKIHLTPEGAQKFAEYVAKEIQK